MSTNTSTSTSTSPEAIEAGERLLREAVEMRSSYRATHSEVCAYIDTSAPDARDRWAADHARWNAEDNVRRLITLETALQVKLRLGDLDQAVISKASRSLENLRGEERRISEFLVRGKAEREAKAAAAAAVDFEAIEKAARAYSISQEAWRLSRHTVAQAAELLDALPEGAPERADVLGLQVEAQTNTRVASGLKKYGYEVEKSDGAYDQDEMDEARRMAEAVEAHAVEIARRIAEIKEGNPRPAEVKAEAGPAATLTRSEAIDAAGRIRLLSLEAWRACRATSNEASARPGVFALGTPEHDAALALQYAAEENYSRAASLKATGLQIERCNGDYPQHLIFTGETKLKEIWAEERRITDALRRAKAGELVGGVTAA